MKREDIYPPGPDRPVHSLPSHSRMWGLHPLVWVLIVAGLLAGVGVYAELVGFYDFDGDHESHVDDDAKHAPSDDSDD